MPGNHLSRCIQGSRDASASAPGSPIRGRDGLHVDLGVGPVVPGAAVGGWSPPLSPSEPAAASSPREPSVRWWRGRGGRSASGQTSRSRCAHSSIFHPWPQHRLLQQVRRLRAGAQQSLNRVALCQHAAPGRPARSAERGFAHPPGLCTRRSPGSIPEFQTPAY